MKAQKNTCERKKSKLCHI